MSNTKTRIEDTLLIGGKEKCKWDCGMTIRLVWGLGRNVRPGSLVKSKTPPVHRDSSVTAVRSSTTRTRTARRGDRS